MAGNTVNIGAGRLPWWGWRWRSLRRPGGKPQVLVMISPNRRRCWVLWPARTLGCRIAGKSPFGSLNN